MSKILVKDYTQRPGCLFLLQHEFFASIDENKAKGMLLEMLKSIKASIVNALPPDWTPAPDLVSNLCVVTEA
jgi:hypothetical protein